jgi:hypothetical protein
MHFAEAMYRCAYEYQVELDFSRPKKLHRRRQSLAQDDAVTIAKVANSGHYSDNFARLPFQDAAAIFPSGEGP